MTAPAEAHSLFPCFDQPDLKGQFQLTIDAPLDWKVVSNAPSVAQSKSDASIYSWNSVVGKETDQFSRSIFAETSPISTYLFAFAAGPFYTRPLEDMSVPGSFYVRGSQAGTIEDQRVALNRIVREGMKIIGQELDYPFPYSKYDMVLLPGFAYGGMEHAGAVFFKEELLLLRSLPSLPDQIKRATLLLHELTHQWFGNLVTMKWFNDLWLKEGFASYLSYEVSNLIFPGWNVWRAFYTTTETQAYLTDVSLGTSPLMLPLENSKDAKSVYGPIVYNKAPALLRQLELLIGREKFKVGIQAFLKKYALSSATSEDFFRTLQESSGTSLDHWIDSWIRTSGVPGVRVQWACDPKSQKINRFLIEQKPLGGASRKSIISYWPMKIQVYGENRNRSHSFKTEITLDSKQVIATELVGKPCPEFVFLNSENHAYGIFFLDPVSLGKVQGHLEKVIDGSQKTYLLGALWDSVREAEWSPSLYIRLALKLLPLEKDEMIQNMVLQNVVTAFNRYLNPRQKAALGVPLDHFLLKPIFHLPSHSTVSLEKRQMYWRALLATTSQSSTLKKLDELLLGKLKIPGMPLQRLDRYRIISTLLKSDYPGAPSLFWAEKGQDSSDEGRRLAYIVEASQPDSAVKNRLMGSYTNDSTLSEDWVLESARFFNQPGQSKLTFPFLKQALALLPEWKKKRKIFFVALWIRSFIEGQDSKRAIDEIHTFLKEKPLDGELGLKVLEALDGLERAVTIQKKFAS